MTQVKITKEQWDAYREVQDSGATNMMNVARVIELAHELTGVKLTREAVLHIIYNYEEVRAEHEENRS